MALLSNKEISLALSSLDDWSFSNNKIHKNFSFNTYMDGIAFVNQLAKIAEENNFKVSISHSGEYATATAILSL